MCRSMTGETELIRSSQSGSHTLNILAAHCVCTYDGEDQDKWTAEPTHFQRMSHLRWLQIAALHHEDRVAPWR